MIKTCVIGASGYTGAELIKIISRHPNLTLSDCFVSENSTYSGQSVCDVHPELSGICDFPLQGLSASRCQALKNEVDAIFLATPHEFSHDQLPNLINGRAKVFDLSGAFRIKNANVFEQYYGFKHTNIDVLNDAIYGLAEWNFDDIQSAKYIAVPGCYPTASLLALKPLIENDLLDLSHMPVINATSGVSGAGKKASMTTSFFEVSLQAYGVLSHRHTPEIEAYATTKVIFTPHLGAFKRGILASLTAFTKNSVSQEDIQTAYANAYHNKPLVRMRASMPKLDQVVNSPFCDISFAFDSLKQCVVATSAIDNLLKGASAQAVQCCNINFGLAETTGLL